MNKEIAEIAKEAERLLKDYPELKWYRAIEKAKEMMMKEEENE